MEQQSAAATITLDTAAAQGASVPAGLRSDLASLHGSVNKLLATRLDAIVTSDMSSPGRRDEARAKRKALVAQSQALIERVEVQVAAVDALRAAATAPAQGV